jgi:hypothetical protein
MNSGGYLLTHTFLAWIYMQENGCELALPEGFVDEMLQANVNLVNLDSTVTDLELESAAFLYLADHGELVDTAFVDCVINAQDDDGGWTSGDVQRWHSTVLGLLVLLHAEYPSDSYPPMLASE